MRASLAIALVLPVALTGCPALLSDWRISGSGAIDASVDATGPDDRGDSSGAGSGGSGASSGSSDASSSGGSSSSSIDAGCASGSMRCSSAIPTLRQSCVAGAWVDDRDICSASTPACFSGVCVECNPGATRCTGEAQPQRCVSGAWTDKGECSGDSPVCLNGSCVTCKPGTTQCAGGTQPQTCSASGAWQDSAPVTHHNGMGQTWQDCVPLGTYNATQAMAACNAYAAAHATSCASAGCLLPPGTCLSSSMYNAACGGDPDIMWTYATGTSLTGVGHVANTVTTSSPGGCPTSQDPSWD